MIDSEYSFIIHSKNPISDDQNEVLIEMVVGQGETLASACQQGAPYRLVYNKITKKVEVQTFASYSYGMFASKNSKKLARRCINYS